MKKLLGVTAALAAALAVVTTADCFQATFTPKVSVTEQYSSNVFLDDKDEEDDFLTIVGLGFTTELLGKNSGLSLSYDPSYSYYRRFDENNSWRHAARLRGWTQTSRHVRFKISDDFLRSEDTLSRDEIELIRSDDPLLELDPTVRRGRNTYTRNVANIQFNYGFGAENDFFLGYKNRLVENGSSLEEDSMGHNPYIGFAYWFSPLNALEGRGDYTYGDYDNDDDFDDYKGMLRYRHRFNRRLSGFVQYEQVYRDFSGDSDDYLVYEPSAGITYDIERDLSLLLRAGYYYQDQENGDDQGGASGEASLKRLWPRATLEFKAAGGFNRSEFDSENLGSEQFYQGGVWATYQFSRRVGGDVNALYRNTEYEDTSPKREDDLFIGGAGLTVRALEWAFFRLGYTFRYRDSTVDTNDYEEHRGQVTLTLHPPRPYRWSD